jgi:TfoX/Sxy family transcriptional regulator of competence genes
MPYNEKIDARIKKIIASWEHTESKKMFGGVCHLLNGNMFCGVYKEFLILRLGEESAQNALGLPNVRPFDITGRPMKEWVMIESEGFKSDSILTDWLNQAKEFVRTLPSK